MAMTLQGRYPARILQFLLAAVLIAPLMAIVLAAIPGLHGGGDDFAHLLATRLSGYFANTLILMAGVGAIATLFGVGTAWMVARYDFPGRGILRWALVLPAAVPAYLVAYTYTDFLEYAGPVQVALRAMMGWQDASHYSFFEIRSMGGAMLVMASVLYPYIYVTTRTAFAMLATRLFEAAILTGRRRLVAVALPLARPGIIAGLALVLMETVSDFGTVEYFAVDTITLGIFNVWLGMNNMALAAQLAVMAAVIVAFLLWLEMRGRAHRRMAASAPGTTGMPRIRAEGLARIAIPLLCLVPTGLGFILPVSVLAGFIIDGSAGNIMTATAGVLAPLGNTVLVAGLAAAVIMVFAVYLGLMEKYAPHRGMAFATLAAVTGYAFPGTILAIGVLVVSGAVDGVIGGGGGGGNIVTGSLAMLVMGYVVRFQAVGYGTVRAGLEKLPPNLVPASRVMGRGFVAAVWRVILPLLKPSILAGLLLASVDTIKELPLSLLLRPFDFETLATLTYQFAHEELLEEAAIPALIIVAAGLVPVIIINRLIPKQ